MILCASFYHTVLAFNLIQISCLVSGKQKKVGKKIQKQRQTEVDKIKDKISDIARDEQRRVKEIFKEHQDIFKKNKEARKASKKSKSIDLYEK